MDELELTGYDLHYLAVLAYLASDASKDVAGYSKEYRDRIASLFVKFETDEVIRNAPETYVITRKDGNVVVVYDVKE